MGEGRGGCDEIRWGRPEPSHSTALPARYHRGRVRVVVCLFRGHNRYRNLMGNKKSCGKNEEKRCKRVCGSLAIYLASESVECIMWIALFKESQLCRGGAVLSVSYASQRCSSTIISVSFGVKLRGGCLARAWEPNKEQLRVHLETRSTSPCRPNGFLDGRRETETAETRRRPIPLYSDISHTGRSPPVL